MQDFSEQIVFGNAASEGFDRRGWFVGHYITENSARCTTDVEVKWGVHAEGDRRSVWSANRSATTLSILIHGKFRLFFLDPEGLPGQTCDVLLAEQGDYVLWLPGTPHTWRAEAASVVITVRYPSVSGDTIRIEM